MGLRQFAGSISRIAANRHIHRPIGIVRHGLWQVRKMFHLFPFEQTLSSSRIAVRDGSCGVSALIYSQGLYDYNNMSFLRWLLHDGGVFVDVGANIGSYTLVASEQPLARVLAFEPHPLTFNTLVTNVQLNRRTNVSPVNMALSERDGEAFLTDDHASATNHLVAGHAKNSVKVPCMRADSYFAALRVTPNYVKIDVEGLEYPVLQGFGSALRTIDVLFIEINGLSNERTDGGSEVIHDLLVTHGLLGPFTCDFDTRALLSRVEGTTEDSLYLSASFSQVLSSRGFRVAT